MDRRRLLKVLGQGLGLAGIAALVESCAPGYQVITSSPQIPLSPSVGFVVTPTDYTHARMYDRSFPEYLGTLNAEQRASWDGDRAGFDQSFDKSFSASAGERWRLQRTGQPDLPAGTYSIHIRINEVSRFAARGFVKGVIALADPSHRFIDQIRLELEVGGSLSNLDTMEGAGQRFGAQLVRYLEDRGRGGTTSSGGD